MKGEWKMDNSLTIFYIYILLFFYLMYIFVKCIGEIIKISILFWEKVLKGKTAKKILIYFITLFLEYGVYFYTAITIYDIGLYVLKFIVFSNGIRNYLFYYIQGTVILIICLTISLGVFRYFKTKNIFKPIKKMVDFFYKNTIKH